MKTNLSNPEPVVHHAINPAPTEVPKDQSLNELPPNSEACAEVDSASPASEPWHASELLPAQMGKFVGLSDPINLTEVKEWRLPLNVDARPEEKQVIAALQKPKKDQWVQTANKSTWIPCYIFRQSGVGKDSTYVVTPDIARKMADCVTQVQLVPTICVDGSINFWALAVPEPGKELAWHTSARAIAQEAQYGWRRVVADTRAGFYRSAEPINPQPDPIWPEQSVIDALLNSTVGRCLIDSEDHPMFKDYLMK